MGFELWMFHKPDTLSTQLWSKLHVAIEKFLLIKQNIVSIGSHQPFCDNVLFHLKCSPPRLLEWIPTGQVNSVLNICEHYHVKFMNQGSSLPIHYTQPIIQSRGDHVSGSGGQGHHGGLMNFDLVETGARVEVPES